MCSDLRGRTSISLRFRDRGDRRLLPNRLTAIQTRRGAAPAPPEFGAGVPPAASLEPWGLTDAAQRRDDSFAGRRIGLRSGSSGTGAPAGCHTAGNRANELRSIPPFTLPEA